MEDNKAIFLDRDGVLNKDLNHIYKSSDFEWIPGSINGLKLLQSAGYKLVVITNQSGIGRGLYTKNDFHSLTTYMKDILNTYKVKLSGVYYCPHHPTMGQGIFKKTCQCRKPLPGMIKEAHLNLNINLSKSILIGDKLSDIKAGLAAGLPYNILVKSGHNISSGDEKYANKVCADLQTAARFICQNLNKF